MNQRLYINYNALRSDLSFATVLNHYGLDFPAVKTQVKITCPFHDEKTPSLSINLEQNKWQCFGCGMKGNTLEFVTYMEDADPEDKTGLQTGALKAIEILGKTVADYRKSQFAPKGSKLAGETSSKAERSNPSQPLAKPEIIDSGASQAVEILPPNPPLNFELKLEPKHPFLEARGITSEIATEFGLGFCGKGVMKDRIAVPIHNASGELVAYSGRWAEEPVPDGTARYKLPTNFRKSLELFNLHRARELAVEKGLHYVVVVEGIWGTIRLHTLGRPTVALLGTAMSPDQAELIAAAGFKRAILLLDGDEAGRKAAPEVAHAIARHRYVHVVELPDGVKPDDMDEALVNQLR